MVYYADYASKYVSPTTTNQENNPRITNFSLFDGQLYSGSSSVKKPKATSPLQSAKYLEETRRAMSQPYPSQ